MNMSLSIDVELLSGFCFVLFLSTFLNSSMIGFAKNISKQMYTSATIIDMTHSGFSMSSSSTPSSSIVIIIIKTIMIKKAVRARTKQSISFQSMFTPSAMTWKKPSRIHMSIFWSIAMIFCIEIFYFFVKRTVFLPVSVWA